MKKYFIYQITMILFLLGVVIICCDNGLSPEEGAPTFTGIEGTVYFENWPPQDSLFDIRLILFRDFPPASISDEIISGRAVLYPSLTDSIRLPFYVDSLLYRIELSPDTYEYFAVAHQYGSSLFTDWQVVGHYDLTPQDSIPTPLTIAAGQSITGLNLVANFDSVLFKL